MGLQSESGRKFSCGNTFSFSTAALLAAALVLPAVPGAAQTAYFSVTGEFSTAGDELDLAFNLDPAVSSPATMRFETFASSGGTNAAGNVIADGPGDSVLKLVNSSGSVIAEDDDQAVLSRDALISFSDGDTPLPSPLVSDNYRLNLADFDDDTDPYAVDLVAPADAFTLLSVRRNLSSLAVIDSLALGTTGAGTDRATFFNTTDLIIDGPLTIGQSGGALFDQFTGTTSVNGTTTVNAGDLLQIRSGATFTANGPIVINNGTVGLTSSTGSTLNINDDVTVNDGRLALTTTTASYNSTVNVNSGGEIQAGLTFIASSVGSAGDVTVTGSNSTLEANAGGLRVGEHGDATLTVADGGNLTSANATLATNAGATGAVTVTGTGSTWDNNGPLFVGGSFTTPGGTGTLTVEDSGEVTSDGDVTIYAPGTVNLNSGGTFNANGNITVDGGTFNHLNTGLNLLAQGRNLLVTNDGLLQTTGSRLFFDGQRTATLNGGADWTHNGELIAGSALGSGSITVDGIGSTLVVNGDISVNTNGTLTVRNSGNLDANGDITVDGGTLRVDNTGQSLLAASGKALLATNGGQVNTTSTELAIHRDQTATITGGADWDHTGNLVAGSNLGDGTITVTGTGSTLDVTGILEISVQGNQGVVNVLNNAQATSGSLFLARSFPNSTDATLNVNTSGGLTTGGVFIGQNDGNQGAGTINLDGAGSTITQTGASILALGNPDTPGNGGVHTVNITNDADFNTGTGATTIRKTGTVNVNTGGELKANGNVNVDGGTLNTTTAGFDLAASKTLNVTNNGQVTMTGGSYSLNNGRTFNVNTGGDLTQTGGNITLSSSLGSNLNVTGAGSTFSTTGVLTASGSNPGTLDLQDNATATLGSLFIGRGSTTANTNGQVNVLSGSTLNLGDLRLGSIDGTQGSGTLTVSGEGSTVNQSGNSTTFIGNVNTAGLSGDHRVTLRDSAVFTTGTGTTTVNATGELRIESNWDGNNFQPAQLGLNGNLLVNQGGQLTGNGVIAPGTTPGGGITNAGTFATATEIAYQSASNFSSWSTQIDVPYTQTAAGTMTFELADIVEGTGNDGLSSVFLSDGYTLAGEARFIASHPGNPLVDFDFLDLGESAGIIAAFGGTRTGVFDTVAGHILGDGTALAVLYNGAFVDAQRVLYGDGNRDGFIAQADLDAVLLNWGKNNLLDANADVSWVTGDYNGDGFIGQADLDAVLLNWGDGTPPTPSSLTAIPEPASVAMLAMGGVLLGARRRRRSA